MSPYAQAQSTAPTPVRASPPPATDATSDPSVLYELEIRLSLLSQWLIHGNDPGVHGMDAVQLCRSDGARIVPGSLLAGRLRETWTQWRTELAADLVPDPLVWLGPSPEADAQADAQAGEQTDPARRPNREPRRGRVHVSDLVEVVPEGQVDPANRPIQPATRVPISLDSGTAAEGMLQFIEQREPPGTAVCFQGRWRAWLTKAESGLLQRGVETGLSWQTQIGALRSVGYGRVLTVCVAMHRAADRAPSQGPANPAEIVRAFIESPVQTPRSISIRPESPFVLASTQVGSNLFESSDIIPGAAIKAALAHGYRQSGQRVPEWFDALRITHAFPSTDQLRPAPIPLALVRGLDQRGERCTWSTARTEGPAVDATLRPADYPIDWKAPDFAAIDAQRRWGATRRVLRVRTAIEGGRAKDHALFAYRTVESAPNVRSPAEARLAPDIAAQASHTRWVAHLDLPEPWGGRPECWRELARALTQSGLGPLGKTDAFAQVELGAQAQWAWPPGSLDDSELAVLMLMTPALLGASSRLLACASPQAAAQGCLKAAYQSALDEAAQASLGPDAAGCLELADFKAAQSLVGGVYLYRRFMRSPRYLPWVLTDAGSVFTLRLTKPGQARQVLTHWQRHGLPLGASAQREHGNTWQTNPYLPQNGYGEACINPEWPFAEGGPPICGVPA